MPNRHPRCSPAHPLRKSAAPPAIPTVHSSGLSLQRLVAVKKTLPLTPEVHFVPATSKWSHQNNQVKNSFSAPLARLARRCPVVSPARVLRGGREGGVTSWVDTGPTWGPIGAVAQRGQHSLHSGCRGDHSPAPGTREPCLTTLADGPGKSRSLPIRTLCRTTPILFLLH